MWKHTHSSKTVIPLESKLDVIKFWMSIPEQNATLAITFTAKDQYQTE
jgi:hypothetical protein